MVTPRSRRDFKGKLWNVLVLRGGGGCLRAIRHSGIGLPEDSSHIPSTKFPEEPLLFNLTVVRCVGNGEGRGKGGNGRDKRDAPKGKFSNGKVQKARRRPPVCGQAPLQTRRHPPRRLKGSFVPPVPSLKLPPLPPPFLVPAARPPLWPRSQADGNGKMV